MAYNHHTTLFLLLTSPASEQMSNDIIWKNVFVLTSSLRYNTGRDSSSFLTDVNFSPASRLVAKQNTSKTSVLCEHTEKWLLIFSSVSGRDNKQANYPKCHGVTSAQNEAQGRGNPTSSLTTELFTLPLLLILHGCLFLSSTPSPFPHDPLRHLAWLQTVRAMLNV